jgi:hypothetical protein
MHSPGANVPHQSFEQAWELADPIKGWLTLDQGRLLWDEARQLGPGATLVEIGSHQGRSTVILAKAVEDSGGTVIAVDPFVEGRLFGGQPTRVLFEQHLATSGATDTVTLLPEYSTKARPGWSRSFDYLYIDGKHDYWTLSDDLKWSEHLPEGAAVLIHDCSSSIGVTLGILAHVLPSRRLRYERRAGSLALFRVGDPSWADRVRILAQLPWWIRNVFIKVLLRLRLRSVARLLRHDSPYDPY